MPAVDVTANIPLIVIFALQEVGYLEKKSNYQLEDKTANVGYNNFTKYGQWYGMNGQAWCDMFVSWCANQAGDLDAVGKSAWVPGHMQMCKERGIYFARGSKIPQPGDLVFFREGKHIGLVEYVEVESNRVHTIEGNTSTASGVEANGGGVFQKSYSMGSTDITGYGRPNYTTFTSYANYQRALTSGVSTEIIFIGDLRTAQMKVSSKDTSSIWIVNPSATFTWFQTSATHSIEARIKSNTAICVLMGFESIHVPNSSLQYCKYINECADRWSVKGASTYFVSVNPVDESKYRRINNIEIQKWNQDVRNGLNANVGYIDTYSAIINNFQSIDGFSYDNETLMKIYTLISESVQSHQISMYSNPAIIGGSPVQIDYTKINPYIVVLDKDTPENIDLEEYKQNGVVGAIVEAGYLYDINHHKMNQFQQVNLVNQLNMLIGANFNFGYYFTARAANISEARSEIYELSFVIRRNSPALGVWIKLELLSTEISVNDTIVQCYQDQLIRLGLIGKIGFYTTKESLAKISWNKFQDNWYLWIIEHVDSTSELQQLLDPTFFDI